MTNDAPNRSPWADIALALIGLLRGALWPGVMLIIFLAVQGPVVEIMRSVPDTLGRTNVLTFGEFRVEMSEEVFGTPDQRLAGSIGGLGVASVRILLMIGATEDDRRHSFCGDWPDFEQSRLELQARGILEPGEPIEFVNEANEECKEIEISDLGMESRNFIIRFASEGFGTVSEGRAR